MGAKQKRQIRKLSSRLYGEEKRRRRAEDGESAAQRRIALVEKMAEEVIARVINVRAYRVEKDSELGFQFRMSKTEAEWMLNRSNMDFVDLVSMVSANALRGFRELMNTPGDSVSEFKTSEVR